MKFGLGYVHWDAQAETQDELETIFKSVVCNNQSPSFYCILIVNPHRFGAVAAALETNGFSDIQKLTWCKSDAQMVSGACARFTEADETIVVARYGPRPKAEDGRTNFPVDPTERMTWFIGKSQKTKLKLGTGGSEAAVCNPYEKPAWLSSFLCSFVMQPGRHAVVFGAGAGGDVKGLLNFGANVTAIENDEKQMSSLTATLMAFTPTTETYKPVVMSTIKALLKTADEMKIHKHLVEEEHLKCEAWDEIQAHKEKSPKAPKGKSQEVVTEPAGPPIQAHSVPADSSSSQFNGPEVAHVGTQPLFE